MTDPPRIRVADLIDERTEYPCESCAEATAGAADYPTLFTFDLDGEAWLTDQCWLLPAAMCDLEPDMEPRTLLPAGAVGKAAVWINASRTAELVATPREFAPTYAGVLTRAGYTAHLCGMGSVHALLGPGGTRTGGLLMPCKTPAPDTTPLPVTPAALTMYRRIADVGVVTRVSQMWRLAVTLTNHDRQRPS